MPPQQSWESRQPLSRTEHNDFANAVRQLAEKLRGPEGLAPQAQLSHYEEAAFQRRILPQVLLERGLLTITRRRFPQTFAVK
jgi:hypothetical protein